MPLSCAPRSGLPLFYVGSSGESGNGLDKQRALRSLGARVESFDTRPYLRQGSRAVRSVAYRANLGPPVDALNRDLLRRAREVPEALVLWVDKGQWLWPETLRALKERWGAIAVHYANDSMFYANRSRHFRACIPLYDHLFTTKRWETEYYRRCGAQSLHTVFDSVDDERFRPTPPSDEQRERFGADALFIGRCERHYARCLHAVVRSGVDLRVWGPRWPRRARWDRRLRPVVRGSGVWFDDYPVALSATRIGLGLLSKNFPEDHTTRSLEIPACGTFLLAERTPVHQQLYEEGREAEFFDGTGELVEKLRYYLAHPDERARIAAAGRARFLRDGHDRRSRFGGMLEIALDASSQTEATNAGRS